MLVVVQVAVVKEESRVNNADGSLRTERQHAPREKRIHARTQTHARRQTGILKIRNYEKRNG